MEVIVERIDPLKLLREFVHGEKRTGLSTEQWKLSTFRGWWGKGGQRGRMRWGEEGCLG